ncbi:hypothetical protein ACFY2N_11025 [Streptomyces rubiginosohelvolus]|uniref:hypothetical protein n=1 Tax=Streptomyces rubiginosohelvolus TaxID=67362 RepID=UPI00367C74DC
MSNPETVLIVGELCIAYQHDWSTDEPTWAVLTSDEPKAADLAARLGGRVREVPGRAGVIEVLLDRNALEAALDRPTPLASRSVQRQVSVTARMGHAVSAAATGVAAARPEPRRTCDQMAEVRAGTGPRPDVLLRVRLAGVEDLGVFRLTSTSWDFVESVRALEAEVSPDEQLVAVVVSVHMNRMTTRSSMTVVFVHPQLSALEPLAERTRWSLAA